MILEGGSVSIAAIRAVQTTFLNGERSSTAPSLPSRSSPSGPVTGTGTLTSSYRECFGIPPHKGLDNADPERASAILRDTLEYWVALQTAKILPEGALLLIDGALRVSSQNHEPVLADIIKTAQERRLLLAAVAKRTRADMGQRAPAPPRNRRACGTARYCRPVVGKDR